MGLPLLPRILTVPFLCHPQVWGVNDIKLGEGWSDLVCSALGVCCPFILSPSTRGCIPSKKHEVRNIDTLKWIQCSQNWIIQILNWSVVKPKKRFKMPFYLQLIVSYLACVFYIFCVPFLLRLLHSLLHEIQSYKNFTSFHLRGKEQLPLIMRVRLATWFKDTRTWDLILLQVVSLDRSWLVGLTDDH